MSELQNANQALMMMDGVELESRWCESVNEVRCKVEILNAHEHNFVIPTF